MVVGRQKEEYDHVLRVELSCNFHFDIFGIKRRSEQLDYTISHIQLPPKTVPI